ncbi:Spy/CpxP family protein refolding chaperone [Maridesulfovibrio bastinii]|uniref:Spy/CpxP family protein refolding chaperone n=1 Tax=Maridesulfovibrio bastinii TaxID=47157 RepID=UPI0004108B70|nr:periplasmic heavy metal sensor [Maridesulfovibrio bastinii]
MKKIFIALALVLAAGFAFNSNSALAWGHGQGHGQGMHNGYMMNGNGHGNMMNGNGRGYMMNGSNAAMYNSPEYKKFMKETRDLRTSLRGDRAEMRAIMAGTNPDSKRVRALAEDISRKEAQLADKAESSNLPVMPMGRGAGFNCPGYGPRR